MTMDVDAGFSFWDEHSLDPQRMFQHHVPPLWQ